MALFVGRESELNQLHGQYAAVVSSGLRCVFLEGPAGIGKTTLLDRFLGDLAAGAAPAGAAPAGGAVVADDEAPVDAAPGERAPDERAPGEPAPRGPAVHGDTRGAPEGDTPAVGGRRRPPPGGRRPAGIVRVEASQSARTHDLDLANRLIDALADGSPRRHPSGRGRLDSQPLLDLDQVRQAGDALVGAVTQACARGPVVVRVDDVHWCDSPSLRALKYLMLHAPRLPLLLLLAGRPHESPWIDGVRRLATASGATINMAGFGVAELAELFATAGVDPPPPRRLWALVDATDGNPLWLTRLIVPGPRAAPDGDRGAGWDGYRDPVSQVRVGTPPAPEPLAALVARDLRACPPDGRRLAAAVAVLGRAAPLAQVATLAGLADPAGALDEALRHGLVGTVGRPPRVTPPHALVRAAIYHRLDVTERTALHLTIAAASSDRTAALEHRAAAALGHDDGLAAELSACAAAESAAGLFARAGDHRLLASRLAADPAAAGVLRLDAAMSFMQAGERADAEAALADGADHTGEPARATGPAGGDDPPSPRRLYVQAHLDLLANKAPEAVFGFMGAWEAARAADDAETAAQCAVWLAQALIPAGYYDEAAQWGRRAFEQAGAPSAIQASGLGMQASALMAATGDLERVLGELAAGERQLEQIPQLGVMMRIARGVVLLWGGDLAGALDRLDPSSWASVDFLHGRFLSAAHYAEAAFRAGQWDESAGAGREVVAMAEAAGHEWVMPFVYPIAALAPAARGDAATARPLLARAAEYLPQDLAAMRAYYATAAAHLAAALDDPAGVVEACTPVSALSNPAGALAPGLFDWRDLHVEALVKLRRLDEAEHALDLFETQARERASPDGTAQALRARGTLLTARGRLDEAVVALDEAIARADQLGMRLPAALARVRVADVHRRRRRTPRAHEALTAALEIFESLGATTYARRCRDLRESLRRQAPSRGGGRATDGAAEAPTGQGAGSGAGGPGREATGRRQGPTERELALLARILRGDDFESIAKELYMSKGHAENVARELYRMHGVTSRAELAGIYLGLRDPGAFPVHPLPLLPPRQEEAEGSRPAPPPADSLGGPGRPLGR
ncbi:AAA family ATPase [Frankia sp. CNm7]|uniref:AAA family ATPase n=1 Tax=Frankia nepalensis TaxID=1836974 RepID=A0A937UQZ6_9ACTN|nr:AAA family ATPase [Frankia nepalensis]MBL7495509.1 AAA family ATPase [Frankia nepalensis]MBL7510878.1 AAA family ATPase [Frankia nepalensis]MBL7520411.1 AAA family ATPase [Frankia nepalensis]MBL7630613.1 AAA family ATPase [Frankia nepalensis]